MKGYKAKNGNYITGKEIEIYNRKIAKERKIFQQQREHDLEIVEKIQTAMILQDRLNQVKQEQRQREISKIKDQVLLSLHKNNPFTYRQYLIIWDMLNFSNFPQIQSDYNRERITKEEILKAMEYVDSFSSEIINDNFRINLMSLA